MPIPPPLQSHTDEPTRTHISRRTLCVCKLRNDGEIEMENVSVSFPFSVPHVTVLKHAKMHTSVHMKIHVCSVPTPGEDRKSSQALSEKKEIKRNVMSVFADERRMSARLRASAFLHASQRRWGIFSSSVSNRSSKERQWPVRLCQLKDVFSCEQYQAVSLTPWWPR